LAAGLALPYRCANGSCGDCRARIVSGEVETIRHHDFTLSEAEKLNRHCLLCSTQANSDISIEVQEARTTRDIPVQEIQAKLCRFEPIGNVNIIALKFVRGRALRFLPGQRISVHLPCGTRFVAAIASCPCNAQYVEFHLSSDQVCTDRGQDPLAADIITRLSSLARNDKLTVNGPTGTFTLNTGNRQPKLFVASGLGFAAVQGLIEQQFNLDDEVPTGLVWLENEHIGQYMNNLCRSWADAFDCFHYHPVHVGQRLDQAFAEMKKLLGEDCELYLSGLTDAQSHELKQNFAPQSRIYTAPATFAGG
jgi:CDP-4-dehydro-6-deoxyglucose reductase